VHCKASLIDITETDVMGYIYIKWEAGFEVLYGYNAM
jgi:hypothetical protein